MKRKGGWIQTYTGRKFYPMNPRVEDISLMDIAHSLALKCRFGGHTKGLYSVAEHSVRMSEISIYQIQLLTKKEDFDEEVRAFADTDVGKFLRIWCLMHDAAEAYLADIPKPIKSSFYKFKLTETKILNCVKEYFNLPSYPHSVIKELDKIMLVTERRDVLPTWTEWEWEQDEMIPSPLKEKIIPWGWEEAEARFMDAFMNSQL